MDSLALKQQAATLGFNRIGITSAQPSPHLKAYLRWVDQHMHGAMGYLARPDRIARRQDLSVILPNVQSIILVALDYTTLQPPATLLNDPMRGRISAYAWGVDYHAVMLPRLEALAGWLQEQAGAAVQHRCYVDTGPVLERSHAQQAGLGFVGKNTMLIHPKAGSTFFLGEILTTYLLEPSASLRETMCGTCTRCLKACPTHAFPESYVLDARRCISYLTIELKDNIPLELRPLMGNWVYGCDICQTVCPWNRFAPETLENDFFPTDDDHIAPPLANLLQLTEDSFREQYANSPIYRIKRARLVRNACVAAGNSRHTSFIPYLHDLTHDTSVVVREHAQWALRQLLYL
ncbi:MAG: tRNA epoxyqueuosine(34) reductase QueG [Anaerolineales bacterium]|nr:tRNA epoxyqueuosine(34) reductase QueG [Anaerolineales bacterium]